MFLLIRFNNLSIVNLSSSMSLLVVSCISFSSSFELRYAEFSFSLLFPPENIFMHSSHLTLILSVPNLCVFSVFAYKKMILSTYHNELLLTLNVLFLCERLVKYMPNMFLMHPFCVFYTHILHIQIF